jgi:hypothetical protein
MYGGSRGVLSCCLKVQWENAKSWSLIGRVQILVLEVQASVCTVCTAGLAGRGPPVSQCPHLPGSSMGLAALSLTCVLSV